MIIRGVNIFPSSLDQILRSFPEVPEYRVTVHKAAEMDQLFVEIEDHLEQPQRVAEELQLRLGSEGRGPHSAARIAAAVRRQRHAIVRQAMSTPAILIDCPPARSLAPPLAPARSTGPTAGTARGYVQANLVILPADDADDFADFCRLNDRPCPLLEQTTPGNPEAAQSAPGADLRSDVPRYRVFRRRPRRRKRADRHQRRCGAMTSSAFCSAARSRSRQCSRRPGCRCVILHEGRNVPMYRTSIHCRSAGRFAGPMVVSMRPYRRRSDRAASSRSRDVTRRCTARRSTSAIRRCWESPICRSLILAMR